MVSKKIATTLNDCLSVMKLSPLTPETIISATKAISAPSTIINIIMRISVFIERDRLSQNARLMSIRIPIFSSHLYGCKHISHAGFRMFSFFAWIHSFKHSSWMYEQDPEHKHGSINYPFWCFLLPSSKQILQNCTLLNSSSYFSFPSLHSIWLNDYSCCCWFDIKRRLPCVLP